MSNRILDLDAAPLPHETALAIPLLFLALIPPPETTPDNLCSWPLPSILPSVPSHWVTSMFFRAGTAVSPKAAALTRGDIPPAVWVNQLLAALPAAYQEGITCLYDPRTKETLPLWVLIT